MTQLTVFLRHAKRSNARELDLSNRDLEYIPKQVYSIVGIQTLNLSNNKISYIDSEILSLRNLAFLDLSNNILTQLPKQMVELFKLKQIILKGNPLSIKFQTLLIEQNTKIPQLKQQLTKCFEYGHSVTPQWLQQSQSKKIQSLGLQWDESIFKAKQNKLFRPNTNGIKVQYPPQNLSKNGVLEINVDDLEIGEQISMGGFSTIHRGVYAGLQVAVKKIFNPNINDDLFRQFNNQITMLSKYRHPKIVLLLGAVTVPPTLCIIMQHIKEGTLYELLHKKKIQITSKQRSNIIKDIISAIHYLHFHGIVHRDIKSHNILIGNNYQIKLCDFGLAKHKSQLNTGPMQFSGTPIYMSQQLFFKKAYDQSVDIFALGTLIYQIYTNQVPYNGLDPSDIKDKIMKDSNLPSKNKIKRNVLQIINKCRSYQVKQRPKIQQLSKFNEW